MVIGSLLARFRGSTAAMCAALLMLHALLLGWAAAANSATFDEPAHLAAGVEYWRHGDFSIYSLSPPLLRLWPAAPVVLAGAKSPDPISVRDLAIHDRHWSYADHFAYANFGRFAFFLMIARWGMIPISCFAGWIVFRWARELYGDASGLAALTIYCLCPSILAHGALVTTDMGTAAAIIATAYLWWRFCGNPSAARWTGVVIALVAAHLCKFTAILLWPMMLAMALAMLRLQRSGKSDDLKPSEIAPDRSRAIMMGYLAAGAATLLLLDAIYGFAGSGQPIGSFHFYSDAMLNLQAHVPYGTPSPLPRLLLEGMDAQKYDTQSRYSGFLFGTIYPSTVWYFYPVSLLCKLPVAMLLLGGAAVFSLVSSARQKSARGLAMEISMLHAGLVFIAGIVLLSDVNIGTRYLLPAFPLCIIPISRLWSRSEPEIKVRVPFSSLELKGTRAFIWVRGAVLLLLAVETLSVCPRFLTFISPALGGPARGWRLVSDSDFDWGQSLGDLHDWMGDHHVPAVSFAYFGLVDPMIYGIRCSPIDAPPREPYVAVSSYYLNGFANRMVTGELQRAHLKLDYCKSLQAKTPVAVVGNTIFIYRRADVEDAMGTTMGVETTSAQSPD